MDTDPLAKALMPVMGLSLCLRHPNFRRLIRCSVQVYAIIIVIFFPLHV